MDALCTLIVHVVCIYRVHLVPSQLVDVSAGGNCHFSGLRNLEHSITQLVLHNCCFCVGQKNDMEHVRNILDQYQDQSYIQSNMNVQVVE